MSTTDRVVKELLMSNTDLTTLDPVLKLGQRVYVTGLGPDNYLPSKIGDDSTVYNDLPFLTETITKTAAEFTSDNPVLNVGQLGYETDTKKGKLGDGITAWNSLDYSLAPNPSSIEKYPGAWTICTALVGGASITINHALGVAFDELVGRIFFRDPAVPGKIYNGTDLEFFVSPFTYGQRLNGINNDLNNCYLQIQEIDPYYMNDSGLVTVVPTTWNYKVVLYKLS